MQILQVAADFSMRAQDWAFCLALLITALFLLEYKRFEAAEKKQEMLDHFLND